MDWLAALAAPIPSVEREMERIETIELVHQVIDALPTAHREVAPLLPGGTAHQDHRRDAGHPRGDGKSRLHYARGVCGKASNGRQRSLPELAWNSREPDDPGKPDRLFRQALPPSGGRAEGGIGKRLGRQCFRDPNPDPAISGSLPLGWFPLGGGLIHSPGNLPQGGKPKGQAG